VAGAGSVELAVIAGALTRAAERALPAMPSALVGPAAETLGTLAYLAAPRARRAVAANLAVIAPERRDRGTLVRRVFIEQTRNYLDVFRIPRIDPQELLASIRTEGWEHFVSAHQLGRGVVVASAHLGPIPLVGQMLVAHGYEVIVPLETERSELQRAINRARRGLGLQFIPTDTPLGVRRVLREGKVLGFLADRATTGVGERVPFFGHDALLPSAHVALAMRSGAPLVPGFALRVDGVMTASFEAPLDIPDTGDREADLLEGVRRWGEVLARYIRRAPEQWAHFERVWP